MYNSQSEKKKRFKELYKNFTKETYPRCKVSFRKSTYNSFLVVDAFLPHDNHLQLKNVNQPT